MAEHAVVIAGGGPTGLMLAGELALAGVDVAIVERRSSQDLLPRAGGLHARTIEVSDQRGIAERFLSEDRSFRSGSSPGFPWTYDFPTRTFSALLGLSGRTTSSASWPAGRAAPVTIHRGHEVAGFAQDGTGVVELSDDCRCAPSISPGATADAAWSARRPESTSRVGSDVEQPDRRGRAGRGAGGVRHDALGIRLRQGGVRDPRRRGGLRGAGRFGHGDRGARRSRDRAHPARPRRGAWPLPTARITAFTVPGGSPGSPT